MKRVCILCESWESGGIEAFITNLIRHIDREGLEIDIVAARLEESVFTAPLKEFGIRFYQLSGSTRKIRENQKRFQQLLNEVRYDVVHLNTYHALSLAYLSLARKAGVPVRIAHSHNTQLRKSLTRPLKLSLHRWARGHYKNVMTHRWACSEAAAVFLFGFVENWSFIPNGIDTRRFQFNSEAREDVRKELGLDGRVVIGNVGRLCYQKNQMFLLDVLAEDVLRRPESCLLLVGEGEDKPKLMEKARTLGLTDNVIFYGTTDKVERLYWAMDEFVFPSWFEGLGIAVVEAQAAGLPVLCSENIPNEALVTEQMTRLGLSAGARVWAEMTLKAEVSSDRASAAERVSAAGFDVGTVAQRIREAWRGEEFEVDAAASL